MSQRRVSDRETKRIHVGSEQVRTMQERRSVTDARVGPSRDFDGLVLLAGGLTDVGEGAVGRLCFAACDGA